MGLFENLKTERVSNLILRAPALASADDSVRDAIAAMRERNLGCVVIVDDDRKPIGMFTEQMLTQLVASKKSFQDDLVRDHAADRWAQIKLSDPIAAVLDALELKNIRFVSVIDDDGRLAGLTGQKGLMEYVAEHFPQVTAQRVGQKQAMKSREGA